MSIARRLGKAVGSVVDGYATERKGDERRDAQRCMLAVMADHPDSTAEEIARIARTRLAKEHGKSDRRVELATAEAVTRLERALAVAALERRKSEKKR